MWRRKRRPPGVDAPGGHQGLEDHIRAGTDRGADYHHPRQPGKTSSISDLDHRVFTRLRSRASAGALACLLQSWED
jgi:hypothetical protein